MVQQLKHGVAYAKAINANARSVEAVVSTETIDRMGDIIDQGSWRLDSFLRNPVILWMHDHGTPIGKAEDIAVRNGQLEARIVFSTTPKAEEIFQLFADKSLRAFSVGFRVGRIAEERTADGRTVTRLLDCELFEISAVTVPANPDALAKHKSLGLVPPGTSGAEDIIATANKAASVAPLPDLPSTGDGSADLARSITASLDDTDDDETRAALARVGL